MNNMQQYIDGGDKISHAIHLIQKYEPEDGYYVAFSGGERFGCHFRSGKKGRGEV